MRIRKYFFLVIGLLVIVSVALFGLKKTPTSSANLNVERANVSVENFSSIIREQKTISNIETLNVETITDKKNTVKSTTSLSAQVVPTPKKVFKLDVPYFHQQYANSCEAASLRMALAYYGVVVPDDMEIVKKFGYKPRDKDVILNEWDDPQEMFVGNIDIVGSTKGYGVYGKPVVRVAIAYGREAYLNTNITAKFLSTEIKAGHPIVLWGYTSLTEPAYIWNLAGGGAIKAFKGEHARLVVGFEGDVNNPTGFFIHDPFNGKKNEYWSVKKIINHVNAVPGVTNQAVVIK